MFGYNKTKSGLQPEAGFKESSMEFLILFTFWWLSRIRGDMNTKFTKENAGKKNATTHKLKNTSKPFQNRSSL